MGWLYRLFVKIALFFALINLVDVDFFSAPFQSPVVRVEKEIESFFSLDSRTAIFNYTIAISRNVETGAERVVAGIRRQGSIPGEPEPGEKEAPRLA